MAQKRTAGRPPKHDWSDKRDVCYKLYIEEKRSMRDLVKYFAEALHVDESEIPDRRDFTRQFKRWGFPNRRFKLEPEDEARLVERIKELWQANHAQPTMLEILLDEGWELDAATLARLRRKHNVLLRASHGYNLDNMGPGSGKKRKRQTEQSEEPHQPIYEAQLQVEAQVPAPEQSHEDGVQPQDDTPDPLANVPPEEAARRMQRLMEIQRYSDSQFASRKRRRRIRGFAHLPPDAAGLQPRYKSETSLDECKAFLQLTNTMYQEVRQKFEDICIEVGIIKKTLCEPGVWQAGKDRLVREHIHLSAMLNPLQPDVEKRDNALEVICSDVTKRMRVMKKRIFVKDANNSLGLSPADSKLLRGQFYEILKADNFQTMLLCGKEHWEELKQRWYDTSDIAQRLYAQGLDEESKRCVDVLLRDAMKRHNDDNVVKFPHMRQHTDKSYGPGPGPARRTKDDATPVRSQEVGETARQSAAQSRALQQQSVANQSMDLDPALFAMLSPSATTNVANMLPRGEVLQTQVNPLPAYFRLAPASRLVGHHPKMWLATLNAPNIAALHQAAASKAGAAKVSKIHGIIKGQDGREDSYLVDGEDELEAYLSAANEQTEGKATFAVVIEGGYA